MLDASGQVIGVIIGTLEDGQNLNFAVAVQHLAAFMGADVASPSPSTAGTNGHAEGRGTVEPSFDCSLASTWAERAICASPLLSALDVQLDTVYGRLREALPDGAFSVIRQRQREWLDERESCGAIRSQMAQEGCLAGLIEERILELNEHLRDVR